jgi:hypothetical protein
MQRSEVRENRNSRNSHLMQRAQTKRKGRKRFLFFLEPETGMDSRAKSFV